MRDLHTWCNRADGTLITSPSSAATVNSLAVVQDDKIRVIVHSARRSTAVPALTPYIEEPLVFNSLRASIGRIDAAPTAGSFKLKVGDQTTDALTWPQTPIALASWKADLLAALVALSNVGSGAIRLDDPTGCPAHFAYLTWIDPERTDAIEIVENRLLPLSSAKVLPASTPVGFTQLLKFTQQPVAMCTSFVRPMPPVASVIETRAGSSGTNAEQTIILPVGAMGGLTLRWSGVSTKVMGVDGLTAAQIATALNEIVVDGATNPSFRVTERTATSGRRFAVEFIGPLANATQALLTTAMSDQIALPYAVGIFDLSASPLPVEQALNGASSASLKFELVIDDPGDETYLVPVTVINDMTGPETVTELEQSGAVLVLEKTVYVNAEPGPYFEVAPAVVYFPAVAATNFVITHGLGTLFPHVRIAQKISADPEIWRQMPDSEFDATATSVNAVSVEFPVPLTAVESDAQYFGNFKLFISSPDSTVQVFAHQHDWDDILDGLPDGQTLRAKLADLDAALGIVGGGIQISAAQITGLLKASQVDLTSLSTGFLGNGQFLDTLRTLVTDPTLVTNLSSTLTTNTAFAAALSTLLAQDGIRTDLITALGIDSAFTALIRKNALDVLQNGVLPDGLVLMEIADIERSLTPLVPATAVTTDLGNLTGSAPHASDANAGSKYTVVTRARAIRRTRAGVERVLFADGDTIVSTGDRWFAAEIESAYAYPKELEVDLFTLHVSESMLATGTRFSAAFTFSLKLVDAVLNGSCVLQVRLGTPVAASGKPANIESIDWQTSAVIEQPIIISDARVYHTFGYSVTRPTSGSNTATRTLYSRTSADADTPDENSFVIQARLIRMDVEDTPTDPLGSLEVAMKGAKASIVNI